MNDTEKVKSVIDKILRIDGVENVAIRKGLVDITKEGSEWKEYRLENDNQVKFEFTLNISNEK